VGRHLTDRDTERVVALLDGWTGTLTWDSLAEACGPTIGSCPARQTLYRATRIRQAYGLAKARLKSGVPATSTPASLQAAAERIARLEAESARLKAENSALLQQFVVWQYNAHIKGMTESELGRPLPAIDRGATESKSKPKPRAKPRNKAKPQSTAIQRKR